MQKYLALLLLIIGAAHLIWAFKQNSQTDLRNLPVIIVVGIFGAASIFVSFIWTFVLVFEKI